MVWLGMSPYKTGTLELGMMKPNQSKPSRTFCLASRRLLTSDEVMKLFGYTRRPSFWAFVRKRGVPFIPVTKRRYLFDEEALKAWLEKRSVGIGRN